MAPSNWTVTFLPEVKLGIEKLLRYHPAPVKGSPPVRP